MPAMHFDNYDKKIIELLQEDASISNVDLAKKIGYKSAASINRIEAGSANIPARKFDKFAEALEMAIKELFGLDEELNNEIKEPAEERLENLKKIAKYHGKKTQLEQLIEESAELIVAVRKYLREAEDLPFANVVEEIADVEVMTNQIKYLFGIENKVEEIKATKIERILKRIGQGG